jgi:transposase
LTYLMERAIGFGEADARLNPSRSLQQCVDTLPTAARIGLETGPLTTWLRTALTAEGLPMVCLDARHAKRALDMKGRFIATSGARGPVDMCQLSY